MSDKEIRIGFKLDGVDQEISVATRKLQNLQQQTSAFSRAQESFAPGSKLGKLSQSFYGDYSAKAVNELKQMHNTTVQGLVGEYRELEKIKKNLKEIDDLEAKGTKKEKEKAEYLDKQAKSMEKINQQLQLTSHIQTQAKAMGSDLTGFVGAGGAGGAEPPKGMFSRILGAVGGWKGAAGMAGSALGAVGSAMMVGGDIYQHRAQRDRQFLQDQSEQQRVANMSLNNMLKGEGSRNLFEVTERRQAMAMALTERRRQENVDMLRAAGGAAVRGIAGAVAGGAAMGAGIGIMGGPIGAGAGAIIGAGVGGAMGIASQLTNARTYNQLFDRNAYKATLDTEAMKNFEQNLAAQKMLNPEKFITQENWLQNYKRYQQVERATGMTTTGLFGGRTRSYNELPEKPTRQAGFTTANTFAGSYQQTTEESQESFDKRLKEWDEKTKKQRDEIDEHNKKVDRTSWYRRNMEVGGRARFSQERIEQAAGELLSAGSTSNVVQGQGSQQVAIMQQMGITNAGRLMGRAAALGEGMKSEDTVKRMIADAMAIGIDKSVLSDNTKLFSEDMRRLLDIQMDIYTKSGGAMGAVKEFEKGVIGPGGMQLEAARTAYEYVNREAGESGGIQGALKWGFLGSARGKELFGKSSQEVKGWLTTANLNNLNAEDWRVKKFAEEEKIGTEEALSRMRELQRSGMFYGMGDAEEQAKQAEQDWKTYQQKNPDKNYEDFLKSPEGESAARFGLKYAYTQGGQFGQQSAKESAAFLKMVTGGGIQGQEITEGWRQKVEAVGMTPTGEQEAALAKDQLVTMGMLNKNLGDLTENAKNYANKTDAQINAMTLLTTAIEGLKDYLKQGGKLTQSQQSLLEGMNEAIDNTSDIPLNQEISGPTTEAAASQGRDSLSKIMNWSNPSNY